MNHDDLRYTLDHSATVRLLRARNAPFILAALYRIFKRIEPLWNVPLQEAVTDLDTLLNGLNDPDVQYPQTAETYLKQWANDHEGGWVRIVRRDNTDWLELTPDAERAIGWVQELGQRAFIGTESRFMSIFSLLEEIINRSNDDPETRIRQLEAQKSQVQAEIDRIQQTGQVDRFTTTQVRERFYQVLELSNQLQRDFASVEQSFRDVAKEVRDSQLQPNARKGSILQTVLDADERLRDSDEGRSFDTFWQILRQPQKQEELDNLVLSVLHLPEVHEDVINGQGLRRLSDHLLNAGNKIVDSNRRLAEYLRRALDEAYRIESRRVRELITEIKRAAVQHQNQQSQLPDHFISIDGNPELEFLMERPLWQRKLETVFEQLPYMGETGDPQTLLDLYENQFFIHEDELKANIEERLQNHDTISLSQLTQHYHIQKGIAEIVTYIAIAERSITHRIIKEITEVIESHTPDGASRLVVIPKVEFRRKAIS